MPEWLSSAIPYFLAIATIAAGGLDLYHRWGELKEKPLRTLVLILFMLIGLLTLVSLHHDSTEKQKADQKAAGWRRAQLCAFAGPSTFVILTTVNR